MAVGKKRKMTEAQEKDDNSPSGATESPAAKEAEKAAVTPAEDHDQTADEAYVTFLFIQFIDHITLLTDTISREQPKKKRGRPAAAAKSDAPAKKATAPKKPRGAVVAKKKAAEEVEESSAEAVEKPVEETPAEA